MGYKIRGEETKGRQLDMGGHLGLTNEEFLVTDFADEVCM